eukprot:143142-Lingulodinium_polyedra.AAC.1
MFRPRLAGGPVHSAVGRSCQVSCFGCQTLGFGIARSGSDALMGIRGRVASYWAGQSGQSDGQVGIRSPTRTDFDRRRVCDLFHIVQSKMGVGL